MGIFSFVASVGEKLLGAPDDRAAEQTWRQAALKNVPAKRASINNLYNLTVAGVG